MEFLDTVIFRDSHGNLQTDMHRKKTSVNALLHATSAHPAATKKGIPTGQFLRARRICSRDDMFLQQSKDLSSRFRERGYRPKNIQDGFRRAASAKREELLIPKQRKQEPESQVRFISTFNGKWREVRSILQKYWKIIQTDPTIGKFVPVYPSIPYRRSPNLKDALVHSYYRGVTPTNAFGSKGAKWGCYQCGDCVACPNIQRATTFHSSDGAKEFKIVQRINCNSDFVVYYATCPCNYIYVGLTSRKLKIRVREHMHDIERAKDAHPLEVSILKPIARHFWKAHGCNSKLLRSKALTS